MNEFKVKNGIVIDNTVPISNISNDITLSANSNSALVTEYAIKTYITNIVSSAGGGDMMKSAYASASSNTVDNSFNTIFFGGQPVTYYSTSASLFSHTSATDNPHVVTQTQVGLSAVDNTSDLNKPISTATQNALNLKFDTSGINQYATSANLNNHIINISNPHSVTQTQVGLSAVDNTSDLNKPISTATQSALNLKFDTSGINQYATSANLNNHIINISNPHSVTKTQVGLSAVDNTSDLNKPISTATQSALNLKLDTSGGIVTGDINMYKTSATTARIKFYDNNSTSATIYGGVGNSYIPGYEDNMSIAGLNNIIVDTPTLMYPQLSAQSGNYMTVDNFGVLTFVAPPNPPRTIAHFNASTVTLTTKDVFYNLGTNILIGTNGAPNTTGDNGTGVLVNPTLYFRTTFSNNKAKDATVILKLLKNGVQQGALIQRIVPAQTLQIVLSETIQYLGTFNSGDTAEIQISSTENGNITSNSQLQASLAGSGSYTLPIATSATLGGVKAGVANTGIIVDGTGVLSATSNVAIWNANQIQGRSVSAVAPLNGQAMIYSSASNVWTPQNQLSDFRLTFSSPAALTTNTFLQADSAQSTGGGSWDITMGHPFPNNGYAFSGFRVLLQTVTTSNTTSNITIEIRRIPTDLTLAGSVAVNSGVLVYTAVIPITINTASSPRNYYSYGIPVSPIVIPDNQMIFAVVTSQTATAIKGCIFHIAISK